MIKKRKFSFAACKKITLAALVSLFAMQSWAESNHTAATLLVVPSKIESTNVKTQGYIWTFELYADPETQTVKHKLINPHPQLKQLNQRAVDIAKDIQFKQLNDIYTAQQNHPNAPKRTTALNIQQPFKFEVKFINHVGYEKRPRRTSNHAWTLCQLGKTAPEYAQFYDVENNILSMQIDLTVSSHGDIQSYKIFKHDNKPFNSPEVTALLSQFKFYSLNNDGRPQAFFATQPFTFKCPESYKNHYDDM